MIKLNPVIVILACALILRVWGINHHFPDCNRYFYETEEYPSVQIAMGFGTGDLNPHSFDKPTLYYYLLFILYALAFFVGQGTGLFSGVESFVRFFCNHTWFFYLLGRLIGVFCGAASVYLIYLIGKRVFDRRSGLLAAGMLAVTPLHVEFSQLALSDMLGLLLAMLSVYYCLLWYRENHFRHSLSAFIFAGFASSAKYYYGFIVIALITAYLIKAVKERRNYNLYLRNFFLGLFALFAAFVVTTPFALLDNKTFFASIFELQNAKVSLWEVQFNKSGIPNWWLEHVAGFAQNNVIGMGLFLVSLLGIAFSVLRRSGHGIIILTTIIFYYAFFSNPKWSYSPLHYLLIIIPLSFLLGSNALIEVFRRFRLRRASQALFLFVLLAPPFVTVCFIDNLNSRLDTKAEAKIWIEDHIPAGSKILMDKIYVPQLSLTKECLGRFTRQRLADQPVRAPSSRSHSGKGRYAFLRDESLTLKGIAYDVYIRNTMLTDIGAYMKDNKIGYIILSDRAIRDSDLPLKVDQSKLARLYLSLFQYCTKLIEFKPNWLNRPGPTIEIFQLNQ